LNGALFNEIKARDHEADMHDPSIWATGGRLQQVWKEALPSNRARAKAAKEALDVRLAEINRNRPDKLIPPVVH